MRSSLSLAFAIATIGILGCAGHPATSPDPGFGQLVPVTVPPSVALYNLQIDPASLTATITPVRGATAQPPQALTYDLDIAKFLTPETLQVEGVRLTGFNDLVIRLRHRHPFPAPNFAAGITAKNRADLGYTGRLFVLADDVNQAFQQGVTLDPLLVREPDGYASPGDLLRDGAGLTNTHFPYMLLVDEAKNNREGVSNGGTATGNYVAATGGWQRSNAGANGKSWTGYDYLHGGQSVLQDITLRRASVTAADWNVQLAVVIQYTDPRGQGGASKRFPVEPIDTGQFAYRLPFAALDVSRVTGNWDLILHPDPASEIPLEMHVRDWDQAATESADTNLSDEADVSKIQPGGAGAPVATLYLDPVIATPTPMPLISGTGAAKNELIYRMNITNTGGAAQGDYWGLVVVTDPEQDNADRGTYHFGVDADTLAPSATRRLDAITVHPVRVAAPWNSASWVTHWGDYKDESANAVAVDTDGNFVVAGQWYKHTAFDPVPGDLHQTMPSAGRNDIYFSRLDKWGNFLGSFALAGTGIEWITSVEADSADNFIAFFTTDSPSLDLDPGPCTTLIAAPAGQTVEVMAKYSPAGALLWGYALPFTSTGSFSQPHVCMTQAADDSIYLGGDFKGTVDFDFGAGTQSRTSNNSGANSDAFVL
ncbi:MAG: hypothetical protein ABI743_10835, partial [bacterium]